MAINNLYPPIVDTYAPAFLVDSSSILKSTCRVYFSLSVYNSYSDIRNAQVTVNYQNTNISALNEELYPCEIMLKNIYIDRERQSDDKYYIEIYKNDIKNNTFEINQYYKVQIRFTSTNASEISMATPQLISSWLSENLSLFSEWSSICLIRGISTPILSISGFAPNSDYTVWTSDYVSISGNISFLNPLETETLKSYRIKLYDEEKVLLIDSGNIYTSNYTDINQLNYVFKYGFQGGYTYFMTIEYTTNNLYYEKMEYSFMVVINPYEYSDASLSAAADEENGRIEINIKGNTSDKVTSNFTLRRTSSESNFTIWEDIYTFTVKNEALNKIWYDYTIKSGIWYKYCIQKRSISGDRGIITELEEPVIVIFDNIFLTGNNKQLKIKFNPQISNFKYTVSESKVDTIGSKYPYIKRNGYTYYRQFPISGTISYNMDEENLFLSKEDIYNNDILELYNDYNYNNRITQTNDYTYERIFREEVMNFLYDNNVKLFRSATEGNIFVKLTDISFSPEQRLGRLIYNFSCNAYEIDEYTIENCDIYNIQSLGKIDKDLSYTESSFGQIKQSISANSDILTILQDKYNKTVKSGYICDIEYLDFLRIEMESLPYPIEEVNGKLQIAQSVTNNTFLGYIVKINGEDIIINQDGIYELKGKDIKITSVIFPENVDVNLSYNAFITQKEDTSKLLKNIEYSMKVGQLWGTFNYNEKVYNKIWNKYYEKDSTSIQSMISLDDITIEADKDTVVYVSEFEENDSYDRHIIGDTEMLTFNTDNSIINDLYFAGIHFKEAIGGKDRESSYEHYYINTGIEVLSLSDIDNPIENGVYSVSKFDSNSKILDKINEAQNSNYENLSNTSLANELLNNTTQNRYIWSDNNWWIFTDSNDMVCQVNAIINYTYELSKGWYIV